MALIARGAAALKCGLRDARIGSTPALKFLCLYLLANNVRFLILPDEHRPILTSQVLACNLQDLSADWDRYDVHPLLLVETFVDAGHFSGTSYRAVGWHVLGMTRSFAKRCPAYFANGQRERVLVHPLASQVRKRLTTHFPPECKINVLMIIVGGQRNSRRRLKEQRKEGRGFPYCPADAADKVSLRLAKSNG